MPRQIIKLAACQDWGSVYALLDGLGRFFNTLQAYSGHAASCTRSRLVLMSRVSLLRPGSANKEGFSSFITLRK